MEKVKTGIYCYLIVEILIKNSEMFVELTSTKQILFTKPLNLIGCQSKQKAKFPKYI